MSDAQTLVRFSDRIVYWAARLAIGTAARVPQWLGYRLAGGLGRLWFRCDKRRQRYALKFLSQAFPDMPEKDKLRLGASATANLFMVPLDMARLTRLLARGGSTLDVTDCSQSSEQFKQLPKPWLGLTAHLGSWEVGAVTVAELVGGAHGIARITKNPLLNDWILKNRQNAGLRIHPRRGGFRDLTRALNNGEAGLQVIDQNQRLRGIFAPFFGKIASCERAAISLALRKQYPVIIAAALRRGRGFRFELVVADQFTPVATGDKQADLLAAITRANKALETLIKRAPEQYLWIHDRYRTQPDDPEVVAAEAESASE